MRLCIITHYSSRKVWGALHTTGLHKEILDSPCLIILSIYAKHKKTKSWTGPASSFPWVKPRTGIVVHIRTLKQALTHELVHNSQRRLICLMGDPSYHTTKQIFRNFVSNRNGKKQNIKTEASMNKLVYLSLSMLDVRKIAMHKFWYDCMKLKSEWTLDNIRIEKMISTPISTSIFFCRFHLY